MLDSDNKDLSQMDSKLEKGKRRTDFETAEQWQVSHSELCMRGPHADVNAIQIVKYCPVSLHHDLPVHVAVLHAWPICPCHRFCKR